MVITRCYSDSRPSDDELRMLSSFHHQNIHPFIGYCDVADERFIVYEHAVNGSVFDHLLDDWQEKNRRRHLTWAQRLKICIGVAKGLQCIHLALEDVDKLTTGLVRSKSILLDETMEAKICIFVTPNRHPTHDIPEPKSDMYSFGVLMLELLSGCAAHVLDEFVEPENQMDLFKEYYRANELDQYIDGSVRDEIDSRCLKIFKETAYRCINRGNQLDIMNNNRGRGPSGRGVAASGRDLRARFTMDQVIERLEDAADFQGNENQHGLY